MKPYFLPLLHLFNGTVATIATGIAVRKFCLAIYSAASNTQQTVNFELSSFAPAFVLVGVAAGYATYVRVGGKTAFWIFLVPVAIFAVKILTFPSPSIFESGIATGWNYFFGRIQCSAHDLYALVPVAVQCVHRMYYLGAIWSALSYSAGATLAHTEAWPRLSTLIKQAGRRRSSEAQL